MTKRNLSGSELIELREEVLNATSGTKEKKSKLIFDGRQYSLRFPKKFIEEAQIDIKEDEFKIILEIPEYQSDEEPK
ncbi:MAG: hypothetical protein ABH864_07430, partial [archaeon]